MSSSKKSRGWHLGIDPETTDTVWSLITRSIGVNSAGLQNSKGDAKDQQRSAVGACSISNTIVFVLAV